MEPRPSRPSRPSQPYISTGATPGQPAGTPAYGPGGGPGSFGAPGPFDASSAPPAAPPLIGYDPSYSPGSPLTPLDSGRGSRFLAPLLAVAALAVIVASVAWVIGRARGGDDDNDGQAAANLTSPIAETATTESGGDQEPPADDATGPADDSTAAVTEAPAAEGGAEPTLTAAQQEGTRRAGNEDAAEDTQTPRPSRERDDARSWLPLTEEVGEGYARTQNQVRDIAEVSGTFPEPADAEAQLAEWGWLENAYREFQLEGGESTATTVYNISVHRFETAAGARDALPYFQDGARGAGIEDASGLPDSGDQIRALQGPTAVGGQIFVVFVREGDVVIRVAGTSLEGDPREDVLALVERILAE